MRKSGISSFLAIVVLSGITFAQEATGQDATRPATAKAPSTRVFTLSGIVTDNGKTLLSDKNDTRWTVTNPDALKSHEGHQVTLKGRAEVGKDGIQVLKVKMKPDKMKPEVTSAARLGDPAFRR